MKLVYSKEARDRLCRLPPEVKKGIRQALEGLQESPYQGKPLQRELAGFWSLPWKSYRVLYQFASNGHSLEIHTLGSRDRIYEEIKENLRDLSTHPRHMEGFGR